MATVQRYGCPVLQEPRVRAVLLSLYAPQDASIFQSDLGTGDEGRISDGHSVAGDGSMKKPQCDWPGYKCESVSEAYFQNVGDSSPVPGLRKYVARCSIHEPEMSMPTGTAKGLPRSWFKRVSFEEYIVALIMEC